MWLNYWIFACIWLMSSKMQVVLGVIVYGSVTDLEVSAAPVVHAQYVHISSVSVEMGSLLMCEVSQTRTRLRTMTAEFMCKLRYKQSQCLHLYSEE